MIIYEVNLAVEIAIEKEFKSWLNGHIAEMLRIDGFRSSEIFEDEGNDQPVCRLVVQYRVSSRANLQAYFDTDSSKMRDEGIRRFGSRFTATRRILKVCRVGEVSR